jgi:hypothetical protein
MMGVFTATAIIIGATISGRPATSDTSEPILDLLVEKGIVTQKEAEKIRAEAEANKTNALANAALMESKWKISNGIKQVELFGDVRVRYEGRTAEDPTGGDINLQRWRYAVRVGLRGTVLEDFYFGLRLDTAANPRSPWVTFGSSTSGSPYQGPFGKSTAGINIGQAYLGWHPGDWMDLTVGKMPNPIYTTPMIWDPDLNPEGAAERFKYTVNDLQLFATFGQFVYQDVNPASASGGLGFNGLTGQNTDNIFQFAWQAGGKYNFNSNTFAKVAATLYNYIGLERSSATSPQALSPFFGDPYIGEGAHVLNPGSASGFAGYGTGSSLPGYMSLNYPFNQVGLDHLLVVDVPFEFDFRLASWAAARFFGDVAYNLEGNQRAEEAAAAYNTILAQNGVNTPTFSAQTSDVKAYQVGFGMGSPDLVYGPQQGLVYGTTSHKHAWEFRTYWQHIEQYSLDPNIIDSDFFEGRENLQGVFLALAYGFSDNIIGTFHYGHANRINDKLGTGGSNQDIPQMNPINKYNLFQVDLTCRF